MSPTTLRANTDRYARYLSTEATGTPRRLTPDDLKALAFVMARAAQGRTHHQILAEWESDFPSFVWEDAPPPQPDVSDSTALIPAAQLQAAHALMLDAQRREQETVERADAERQEWLAKVEALHHALGKAEGELHALRSQGKPWWARLFGRT
jgi:hypothetical protein